MHQLNQRLSIAPVGLFLLSGLFLCFYVYRHGLVGPFLLDDMWNLGALSGGVYSFPQALDFVSSNVSGPLGRPVSMLSFLINDNAWPSAPLSFKTTNLAIHFICGLLIFIVAFKLMLLANIKELRARYIAVFIAVFWLVHPFNMSTVLYVIQRMTQLAAMFSLLALWLYLLAREHVAKGNAKGVAIFLFGVLPCIGLSILSKESGILTFLFIILIEAYFFSGAPKSNNFKWLLRILIIVPISLAFAYLVYKNWDVERVYARRTFSFEERIFTEFRIIIDYLANIVFPNTQGSGLIHDDIALSTSLLSPISTLYSVLIVAGLLFLSFLTRKRAQLLSFGIAFFFAGHALESTFLPLELYFEHRNYLPMFGVLLVIAFVVNRVLDFEDGWLGKTIAGIVCFLYLTSASALTHQNAKIWSNTFDLLTFWATEHPDSQRVQRVYGQFLGKSLWYNEGIDVLQDSYLKHPDDIGLPLAVMNIVCEKGLAESPYTLSEIKDGVSLAHFNGGLVTIAKNFINNYLSGDCVDDKEKLVADEIVLALTKVPGFTNGARADLLYAHGESYARRGNLDGAMRLMDLAYQNQRVVVVPYRQAQFLASAGLYDDALTFVDKAYEADKNRSRSALTLSEKSKIDQLKNNILKLKGQHDSSN